MDGGFRKLVLLLFFASFSVLATFFVRGDLFSGILLFMLLTGWVADIIKKNGKALGVIAALMYILFAYLTLRVAYFPTFLLSLAMFSFPFFFGFEVRGDKLPTILRQLGVRREGVISSLLIGVAAVVFVVFPLILAEAVLAVHFNLEEPGRVAQTAKELPLYILLLSFTFTPVAEEVLFRGFLLPRVGVLVSALLFALAHFYYGSLIEFAASFTAGVVFAFLRNRNSLLPCIFAHATFNFISVIIILLYVRA